MNKTTTCDFCKVETETWVDGKTIHGPWANMCPECYKKHGIGQFGTGLGQLYKPEKASKKKPTITYEEWIKQVDRAFELKFGVSTSDIPDRDYYKAYRSGISPQAYVKKLKLKSILGLD